MDTNEEIISQINSLKSSGDLTYAEIAKVINSLHNTGHTKDSVRGLWRRNGIARNVVHAKTPPSRYKEYVPLNISDVRALIIPDLHIPFMAEGFFEFLDNVRNKYRLTTTISVGDKVDQCAVSAFEKDPDGLGANNELLLTRHNLRILAELFPKMYITIGNHDNRHLRMAKRAGLPEAYIKDFLEIFETPDTWTWHTSYILNEKTLIEHGRSSGRNATYQRALTTAKNVIQGHTHSYAGVEYINDGMTRRWAMNVGCGIDPEAYAFRYAVNHKHKPTLACGVLLGNMPVIIPFNG